MDSTKIYDRQQVCQTYFFPQLGGPLPRTDRAGPIDLHIEENTRIGGYWCRKLDRAPCILYFHGNGECIADQLGHWPQWAEQAGANIFFLDYPGYASSDGVPTFTSCCHAALAALDHLLARPADEVPAVVVMGRSVGSIFALHAASSRMEERVQGLVLESGIADLKVRLDMRLDYQREGIDQAALHEQLDQDFDHQSKMERITCPVLVLHTKHDSLIPMWNSERLAWWAGERLHQLVLFDLGDHNSIQLINGPFYRKLLAQFVASLG